MDGLQGYKAFIRAIEIGSFSAVGREQGISQSTVSKQIASLEATLGVQLFARTTRKVRPTAEALRLYPHVRQLFRCFGRNEVAPRWQARQGQRNPSYVDAKFIWP
ncbi:LysR family transcriptional regulator [Undibacterium arcticum]